MLYESYTSYVLYKLFSVVLLTCTVGGDKKGWGKNSAYGVPLSCILERTVKRTQ